MKRWPLKLSGEIPTAQARFNEMLSECELDWNKIYCLSFRVEVDTREFEYKHFLLEIKLIKV